VRRLLATVFWLAVLILSPSVPAEGGESHPTPLAQLEPEELAARQAAVDRHLLRVQQERFEAEARGDDARRLKRLGREFRRTQERRRDLARAAEEQSGTRD
jgi:hypothetical protein